MESELDSLRNRVQDLELSLAKLRVEKEGRDMQIRALQEDFEAQVTKHLIDKFCLFSLVISCTLLSLVKMFIHSSFNISKSE